MLIRNSGLKGLNKKEQADWQNSQFLLLRGQAHKHFGLIR